MLIVQQPLELDYKHKQQTIQLSGSQVRAKMPVYLSLSVASAHQRGQRNNCQFCTVYVLVQLGGQRSAGSKRLHVQPLWQTAAWNTVGAGC